MKTARQPLLSPLWVLFERPSIYRLNQQITGRMVAQALKRLLKQHLALTGGEVVLDIGCGVGDYVSCFPDQRYIGIDINSDYIEQARQAYGHSANVEFLCQDVNHLDNTTLEADCAYCAAVSHHLTNDEILNLVHNILKLVKGKFVIVDFCLPSVWRNPLAYVLVKLDRGRYGRTRDHLVELLRASSARVTSVTSDFGFPFNAVGVTLERRSEGPAS